MEGLQTTQGVVPALSGANTHTYTPTIACTQIVNCSNQRNHSCWMFATWNVRSLMDNEGPVQVAQQRSECRQLSQDRRSDLVVRELDSYRVNIAALQETKWFGEVYKVGGSVVITAGCPTPKEDLSKQRGEGVAIVLRGHAIDAWKNGRELRKSWRSKLLRVTLDTG